MHVERGGQALRSSFYQLLPAPRAPSPRRTVSTGLETRLEKRPIFGDDARSRVGHEEALAGRSDDADKRPGRERKTDERGPNSSVPRPNSREAVASRSSRIPPVRSWAGGARKKSRPGSQAGAKWAK